MFTNLFIREITAIAFISRMTRLDAPHNKRGVP